MRTTPTEPTRGGPARFRREIAIILIVKTLALVAIWHVWFRAPARPHVDGKAVAERVYSSAGAAAPARDPHARP